MVSPQDAERIVQQWFQALNSGDPNLLDDIIAKDFVDETAFPGQAQGLEGHKQAISMLKNAAPDYQGEPLDLSVRPAPNGATSVLITHRDFGTITGAASFMMFAGTPPNEPVKLVVIDEVLIDSNGKIVRHRSQRAPLGVSAPVSPTEAFYPALPGGQAVAGPLFGRPTAMQAVGPTSSQNVWGNMFTTGGQGGQGSQSGQGGQGGQGSGVAPWASGGEGGSTGQGGAGAQSLMGPGAATSGGQTGGGDPFSLMGPVNR